jgi:hypothetical protein
MTVAMWTYFWIFYSVSLVYMFLFAPVLCCFFFLLWFSNVVSSQMWYFQPYSFCSEFLLLFRMVCPSICILRLFFLIPWRLSLEFWWELLWICITFDSVTIFIIFWSKNMGVFPASSVFFNLSVFYHFNCRVLQNLWLTLRYWGLNSGPIPWTTPLALFCLFFFWDQICQTICSGWLWTTILLISASCVARLTGMSHQCPALFCFGFGFLRLVWVGMCLWFLFQEVHYWYMDKVLIFMLHFCPATSLKVFDVSKCVLLDSFRSFSCRIMAFVNGKFDFFLSYSYHLYFFLLLSCSG